MITHKKRKPSRLALFIFFLFQSLELHTFLENMRPVRKRRIRFLTDAKIVVFFFSGVVGFVVFAVVLRAHLQSSVFKLSKDLIDSIHEEGIVAYTS